METYIDRKYAVTYKTICSYTGSESNLTIPSRFVRIIPDTLGEGAFMSSETLRSVTIPACIRRINSYCFFECSSLNRVIFQGNVKKTGENAFPSLAVSGQLKELTFSGLAVTEEEYRQLKNGCAFFQDGLWITEYIPWNLLPEGLHLSWPAPGRRKDPDDRGSHIPKGISGLLAGTSDISPEEEELLLKYLPHSGQEYISPAAEADNDAASVSPSSVPGRRRLSAYFCFDDSRTEKTETGYILCAFLRRGYFFWQSAKRLICHGQEYFIYRRHYLTDSSSVEYIRQDMAVYTRSGPVRDPEEKNTVYAKYRLLSSL